MLMMSRKRKNTRRLGKMKRIERGRNVETCRSVRRGRE
jgi:hypothetical protein